MSLGHYYAMVKAPNDLWWAFNTYEPLFRHVIVRRFPDILPGTPLAILNFFTVRYRMDDSSVTVVDERTALGQQAYMLFYTRETEHIFGKPEAAKTEVDAVVEEKPKAKPLKPVTAAAVSAGGEENRALESDTWDSFFAHPQSVQSAAKEVPNIFDAPSETHTNTSKNLRSLFDTALATPEASSSSPSSSCSTLEIKSQPTRGPITRPVARESARDDVNNELSPSPCLLNSLCFLPHRAMGTQQPWCLNRNRLPIGWHRRLLRKRLVKLAVQRVLLSCHVGQLAGECFTNAMCLFFVW